VLISNKLYINNNNNNNNK